MMRQQGIPPSEVEQVAAGTAAAFALRLRRDARIRIEWDELDLRQVAERDGQVERIRRWGRLTDRRPAG
jgi:hypothetical protein